MLLFIFGYEFQDEFFIRDWLYFIICLVLLVTPCQISPEVLWILQQYFCFSVFVFMYVVHVSVCTCVWSVYGCQRTALDVILQEWCQLFFETLFFSHCPITYTIVREPVICLFPHLQHLDYNCTAPHRIFLKFLGHERRSSCPLC